MIFLDVETTGLDRKACSMASVGIYDNLTGKEFYEECGIFGGAKIEPKALEINGFTEEQLIDPDKKTLEEVLHDTLEFIKMSPNRTIAGANTEFDREFIQRAIRKYEILDESGRPLHFGGGAGYDLLPIYMGLCEYRGLEIPTKNERNSVSLDVILSAMGLGPEPRPHNALRGAKLEAEAHSRMIYGRNLIEEYKHLPIPAIWAK
ncbi:MAG: 3'-5' exonuclease [Nanoarchaeota archaeon]|nr:3'-5' exonuclease [Nanoarchaeota archaeon]